MGNKATSPETRNIQNSSLEASSGLHFLEVHFPTLGAGMGLVIIGAIMLYFCLRRHRKNKRRPEQPSPQMHNPYFNPNFNSDFASPFMNHIPMMHNFPVMPAMRPTSPRITYVEEDTTPGASETAKKLKK